MPELTQRSIYLEHFTNGLQPFHLATKANPIVGKTVARRKAVLMATDAFSIKASTFGAASSAQWASVLERGECVVCLESISNSAAPLSVNIIVFKAATVCNIVCQGLLTL